MFYDPRQVAVVMGRRVSRQFENLLSPANRIQESDLTSIVQFKKLGSSRPKTQSARMI
jgi:hypothetical protein